MRYFVVSDIHSFYTPLIKSLDEKGFNKDNDTLIVCASGKSDLELVEKADLSICLSTVNEQVKNKCDLVINANANLPEEIINKIIEKFKEGVTFFHEHNDYDFSQVKENYEVSIL